jgi:exopolysaccharide/PEP-CTERM locus tyrosine autokinase
MGKFFEALNKTGQAGYPMPDRRISAGGDERSELEAAPLKEGTGESSSEDRKAPIATLRPIPLAQEEAGRPVQAQAAQSSQEDHSIPELRRLIPELVTLHNRRSFEAEQFKLLRTQLLFPKPGHQVPRTLMVTSALPGEGKSFVSANLAVSIAQGIEEHVLLIDCDLRRPTLHHIFGYDENMPGLSRYLSDSTVPLSRVLLKTGIDKLTLLPAGRSVVNPAELLSSPRMMDLIGEVRERYDDRYIIIDTPPPKMISEANALARQVDGILLVVRYGKTPRNVLKDLVETIGREKIIGTVMNRFDFHLGSLYGSYYNYRSKSRYYR